jgi:hypothetical protein
VKRRPDFGDLVGDDLAPGERERLRRVHDLLVAAGPPPELTPALKEPPRTGGTVTWLARGRLRSALALAAALAVAAFALGFALGGSGTDSTAQFDAVRSVELGARGNARVVVSLGKRDRHGNYPMLVRVEGLKRQTGGNYYSLFMVNDGKPVTLCGTFNVAGPRPTAIRLNTAYGFEGYDGLMLAEYRASDHTDHPLLQAAL